MQKYVKFTGNFRDLIPDGWHFWKAYARNYRVYSKTCDGKEYSPGCSIWQHMGGYFEIMDYHSDSWIIVDQITQGKLDDWITHQKCILSGSPESVCWMVFDQDEMVFHPYHSPERHQIVSSKWDKWKELENKTISDEDYDAWMDGYHKRYREANFNLKLLYMVKDLVDKGWIEVAEDKRKRR